MDETRKSRLTGSMVTFIVVLAFLSGIVGGIVGPSMLSALNRETGNDSILPWTGSSNTTRKIATTGVPSSSFADVSADVIPSVVNIDTESRPSRNAEDLLRRLFGNGENDTKPRSRRGLGSGMIIRSDGLILTNEHVIRDADTIKVTLSDGRKFDGRVIGKDTEIDTAVIKVDADDLPALTLGDSSALRPGDWAIAVGNPLGLSGSVSVGVISALNRPIHVEERAYSDLIQTDVAIIPGNSGGPLIDAAGNIIGINNAIEIDMQQGILGAAAARVGFAIPINSVKEVLGQLVKTGRVIRPWVGISMKSIQADDATKWKLPQKTGVIIIDVMPNAPAHKAGLRARDIILSIDDVLVKDSTETQRTVRRHKVGDVITFHIKREVSNGKWDTLDVKVKTVEMPPDTFRLRISKEAPK
jgi:serine protease Do